MDLRGVPIFVQTQMSFALHGTVVCRTVLQRLHVL